MYYIQVSFILSSARAYDNIFRLTVGSERQNISFMIV